LGKSIEEGQEWIKGKLEKDYLKLSAKSKEKYKNEFETVIRILTA
jgi:hypothetical protein